MEMQILCLGTEWKKSFNCCSLAGMKFGSLQVRQCPTAPSDVKAKIIQDEQAKENQQSKVQ